MPEARRTLWQILRKMLGARSQLPFADTEAALSQLPEATLQQVSFDERSAERLEIDGKR